MKLFTTAAATAALALAALAATPALAKLPAPSDEAKAKAAEAAAKTAHGTKVANYQLCKSMDKVAAEYFTQAKKDGKAIKPADPAAAACADPGPFVYTPPPAPGAPASAVPPPPVGMPAPAKLPTK